MACPQVIPPSNATGGQMSYDHTLRPSLEPATLEWIARSNTELVGTPMDGWPMTLDPTIAWDGTKLQVRDFTYILNNEEIREIELALAHFKALHLAPQHVSQSTFPLPNLSMELRVLAEELHNGRGFFAMRGLNPKHYLLEDNAIIFLGISSYVGEERGIQDDAGHIFAHIREARSSQAAQSARPIRDSNLDSPFHTDSFGDIVAMQTRSRAASGGAHLLASTAKIYNELAMKRPDLVRILATPNWSFDTRGSLTPPCRRALIYYHDGKVIMNFNRDPLLGRECLPRSKDMPTVTALQREALDVVQAFATRYQCVLDMEPGDLTFTNNMSILHTREAFEDSDTESRYLVRLWLKNAALSWSLPPELAKGNSRSFCNGKISEDWNITYKARVQFTEAEIMTP